jgi:hypothetical protein
MRQRLFEWLCFEHALQHRRVRAVRDHLFVSSVYVPERPDKPFVIVRLIQRFRMRSEEVLTLSRLRCSHVVSQKVHFPYAEMPRQIDKLKPGIPSEMNVIRLLAQTVSTRSLTSFYSPFILFANISVLRPQFTSSVVEQIKIRIEPARIAKIKDIKKIAQLVSIIKTENANLSASMERSNVFDVFA